MLLAWPLLERKAQLYQAAILIVELLKHIPVIAVRFWETDRREPIDKIVLDLKALNASHKLFEGLRREISKWSQTRTCQGVLLSRAILATS